MILKIENLSKSYFQGGREVPVLKNLNLYVREGESVAILGPSGSGKSTFLSVLAGLDRPTSGRVEVAGHNLPDLTQKQLAQFRAETIGIVFQQFHLLPHLTALENVMLPLQLFKKSGAEEKARALLKRVRLEGRETHFPNQLSGGENQRVAIARALIVEPELLLADEPSGNLDSKIGQEVMSLLFEVVQESNSTLLLVTHNEELALRCQRQIRLRDGAFL